MHDYKFRGKRIDNGEWVYGSLLQSEIAANGNARCAIVERFADCYDIGRYEVEPGSVGMWTGFKDDNFKYVYEGDQIKIFWLNGDVACEVVSFSEEYGYFMYGNNPLCELKDPEVPIEVVGNVYENAAPTTEGTLNMNTNFDPGTKQEEAGQPAEEVKNDATETTPETVPDGEKEQE